jgi:hypothetical protein
MFKLQPIKILNSKTKERFLLNSFDHTKLTDEELVEVILLLKACSKEVKEKLAEIELNFSDKLKERNAHKYQDSKVSIEVKQNNEYEYNAEIIEELKPLITDEQFRSVFTKSYTVNRKTLKNLIALGGIVKDIIERATKKKEYKPTIKVSKIV